MRNILIIDDDIKINEMLSELLAKEGYSVLRAYSGTEASALLETRRPDLILLDLMLPGISGEEILPKISDIPVIVVSAKTDFDGKARLLLDGAADYVTKPFNTKELLARIAVQFRNIKADTAILTYKEIRMNTEQFEVFVGEKPVRLTKTEFAILKILMQNPLQVIPKSTILDKISEDTPDCMESSLRVHISNIRSKLREINGVDYIEAVWGIGFKLK